MKTRVCFLLILLSIFLLTQKAISGTWTDIASGGLFTLSGTTVSTSGGHGGHGTTYYRVSN